MAGRTDTASDSALAARIQQIAERARRRRRQGAGQPGQASEGQRDARDQAGALEVGAVRDLFEELLPPPSGDPRYPTLFTRLPLFVPTSSRKRVASNWERPYRIETSWGAILRYGPGLTTYDEDTLIAIFHLCQQRRLRGPRHAMPIPVADPRQVGSAETETRDGRRDQAAQSATEGGGGRKDEVEVLVGWVTAHQINKFLGRPTGGRDLKRCRESIDRLGVTTLKVIGWRGDRKAAVLMDLLKYRGELHYRGPILVQIQPNTVRLLRQYTYIDVGVRGQLTDVGKAIHRFLSSQISPKNPVYECRVEVLRQATGYLGTPKEFTRALRRTLEDLVRLRWLESYQLPRATRYTDQKVIVVRRG